MIEKLIEKYVNKIDKKDIIKFAKDNDVILTSNEIDLIYDNIKLHWKEIIFDDYKPILKNLKAKINNNTYKKMENLIILYKEKYKNYL